MNTRNFTSLQYYGSNFHYYIPNRCRWSFTQSSQQLRCRLFFIIPKSLPSSLNHKTLYFSFYGTKAMFRQTNHICRMSHELEHMEFLWRSTSLKCAVGILCSVYLKKAWMAIHRHLDSFSSTLDSRYKQCQPWYDSNTTLWSEWSSRIKSYDNQIIKC